MTKTFTYLKQVLGKEIRAVVIHTDDGITAVVAGGDKSHIGAVSITDKQGQIRTTTFPTHKEAVITESWAKALWERTHQPAVVTAGVHYDNITMDDITAVVNACDLLLASVICDL